MNEYCYKPKRNPLPKLNLTGLNTPYNTFYFNNSKSKINTSNQNTFRIPNTNANTNTSIFTSVINSNEKEIYLKTSKNFYPHHKMNKKNKKIHKSNLIFLTEFSNIETDDTCFAMSEIKRIDTNIKKRINKNLIWKEKQENIYDLFSAKNKTDIKNVKERVRQNLSGINFNLRKENNKNNYFPSDNIETIKDANKIISRIKNNILQERQITKKYNHFNKINLHTFRAQNRDICLNNILINLIKSELRKIKKKENTISNAFKEANKDFEKDKDTFENFNHNELKNFRLKEIKLDEAIKQNKVLYDEIKKVKSELYSIKDEVKKYMKDILAFINYENFIKKILFKKDNNKESTLEIFDSLYIKDDKDFDMKIKYIIEEYYNKDMNDLKLLTTNIKPQMVTNLFITMESNIINALEQRDLIIKEIKITQKKYESQLEDLKLKVIQNQKELDILYKELNIARNLTTPKIDLKEFIEENENYIMILYKELLKYIKDKNIAKTNNLYQDTFNLLHILEDKLLEQLEELNTITSIKEEEKESIDSFKQIIDKIKLENKRKKQNDKKFDAKKQFEEKIKIHPRKIFPNSKKKSKNHNKECLDIKLKDLLLFLHLGLLINPKKRKKL